MFRICNPRKMSVSAFPCNFTRWLPSSWQAHTHECGEKSHKQKTCDNFLVVYFYGRHHCWLPPHGKQWMINGTEFYWLNCHVCYFYLFYFYVHVETIKFNLSLPTDEAANNIDGARRNRTKHQPTIPEWHYAIRFDIAICPVTISWPGMQ